MIPTFKKYNKKERERFKKTFEQEFGRKIELPHTILEETLCLDDEIIPAYTVVYKLCDDERVAKKVGLPLSPSIGGTRMRAGVNIFETFRLAEAMYYKCGGARIPCGGGKSSIDKDPKLLTRDELKKLVVQHAKLLDRAGVAGVSYLPAEDMGVGEWLIEEMGNAIGRRKVVGFSKEAGGVDLNGIMATGLGMHAGVKAAYREMKDRNLFEKLGLQDYNYHGDVRIAIHGFGSVGYGFAHFYGKDTETKGKIVAIANSSGTIINEDGLAVEDIKAALERQGSTSFAKLYERTDLPFSYYKDPLQALRVDAEILVPAAIPDIIATKKEIEERGIDAVPVEDCSRRWSAIIQGANIPITREAERILYENGTMDFTDFAINSGGVIAAYVERAYTPEDWSRIKPHELHEFLKGKAIELISQKLPENMRIFVNKLDMGLYPREAAVRMAEEFYKL